MISGKFENKEDADYFFRELVDQTLQGSFPYGNIEESFALFVSILEKSDKEVDQYLLRKIKEAQKLVVPFSKKLKDLVFDDSNK